MLRGIVNEENLKLPGSYDPLVKIDERLLQRPIYFEQGLSQDPHLYLRKPAFLNCLDYDRALQKVGLHLRICDAFRPREVQRKGFCWGLKEILKKHHLPLEKFKKTLLQSIQGSATSAERHLLTSLIQETDDFFSYVQIDPKACASYPKAPPLNLTAAANLKWLKIAFDKNAVNAHNSGGVVDVEFLTEKGVLLNLGVAVDTAGIIAAFPYFEDKPAPILKKIAAYKRHALSSVQNRKKYYKEEVQTRPELQNYLTQCGVDLKLFLKNQTYFETVWKEIRRNRRVVLAVADQVGMEAYGKESWHFDCTDPSGISGGPGYAVYHGQSTCTWGPAEKLYVNLS